MNNKINIIKFKVNEVPILNKPSSDKKYIKFGEKNEYPNKLISYYENNSLHSAIINKKIGLINTGLVDNKQINDYFLNQKDTIDDLLFKITTDLEIFNGFALNIVWSKDRKSISLIEHINFSNVRSGPVVENKVDFYYFSEDWANINKIKPTIYPSFTTEKGVEPSQIYYVKNYNLTSNIYPLPNYQSSLNDIDTYIQISSFNNSIIKNGMTPSILINIVGVPSEAERQEVLEELEEQYSGSENAGKFVVTFSDNPESKPTIETIQLNNSADYFNLLEKSVRLNIIQGHMIPECLIQNLSGSLGNRNEIINASKLFYNEYIKYRQTIIENSLNELFKINGFEPIEFNKPVNQYDFSESVLQTILTVDELRALYGYEPKIINNTNG